MASIPNEEESNGSNNQDLSSRMIPSGLESSLTTYLPPLLAAIAFASYQGTRTVFHNVIDVASGHNWKSVDGGALLVEMVRPVLNGPVTLSISILFGTLVATTVSTLYNRQINLRKTVISASELVGHLHLLVDGFPDEGHSSSYRSKAKQLLRDYGTKVLQDLNNNNVGGETLSHSEINAFLLLLNDISKDPNNSCPGAILGEAYACVGQMIALRSEFRSNMQTVFSPAHYTNMVALASTILFVFLLETDQDSMQYLLGFQLSICWALLVGTYALLAVVVYDLLTPFSGSFSVWRSNDKDDSLERLRRNFLPDLENDDGF